MFATSTIGCPPQRPAQFPGFGPRRLWILGVVSAAAGAMVGCGESEPPSSRPEGQGLIAYELPTEGRALRLIIHDAERLLGITILVPDSFGELNRRVRVADPFRGSLADARVFFRDLLNANEFSLFEIQPGPGRIVQLECHDSAVSAAHAAKLPFVWERRLGSATLDPTAYFVTTITARTVPIANSRKARTDVSLDMSREGCIEVEAANAVTAFGRPATLLAMKRAIEAAEKSER